MKTWTKVAVISASSRCRLQLGTDDLPADVGMEPNSSQTPFFVFPGLSDAVLLGLEVSFLSTG